MSPAWSETLKTGLLIDVQIISMFQFRFPQIENLFFPYNFPKCWPLIGWGFQAKLWRKTGKESYSNSLSGYKVEWFSGQFCNILKLSWVFALLWCRMWRLYFTSITAKIIWNSKWVWSGNTTIINCRQPRGTARKSCPTITRHQEDKLSKAISSLFPNKMIAILEWT